MFVKSDMVLEKDSVDVGDLGLYLALNMKVDELAEKGLDRYCPTRKNRVGAPPVITGCAIKNNKAERLKPWNPAAGTPNESIIKVMYAEALRIVVKAVMSNHLFEFDHQIKKQVSGGAIGLELTGDVAQIFMMWYDQELRKKMEGKGINILLYKRYVDDINMIFDVPHTNRDDRSEDSSLDSQWMSVVRDEGNSIHPSIQLTSDFPSNHEDGKMPILDLKVWLRVRGEANEKRIVMHEYYYKEVATKALTHARSAMPLSMKRTTITQELLRVMLRCSPEMEWEEVVPHLDNLMMRIQYSGYDRGFRAATLRSALKAYEEIKRKDRHGIRPIYRKKEWNQEAREKSKRTKKRQWFRKGGYRSVVFIPATPKSVLKRKYEEIVKKSGIPMKVVEKSGTTIKKKLQTSNPFKDKHCRDKENCFVCRTGGSNCRREGINYSITCDLCNAVYIGESGRNAYTRGQEHEKEYQRKSNQSVLWRHVSQCHSEEATPPTFKMRVTAVHDGDPTMRQVLEGIQIGNTPADGLINNKSEWMAGRGIVCASVSRM